MMEAVYKIIQLDNGDILLKKNISDEVNYNIEYLDNGNILLKKIKNIIINNYANIKNYDFNKSIIINCLINDTLMTKLKFKSILTYIYELIDDGAQIIKNTKLNIKTIKKEDNGFCYQDNLGISVQYADSNKTILEIVNQCIENKIKISMNVKLITNNIINLNFV